MADEPISLLTKIPAPPYSAAFTNQSTGAMLELLDTTNTSMASSGTNSRIAPGDLLKGYLAAGTNVTLTETAGIVTIAAAGGGGMTNPMTTAGDLIDGGSAGVAQRLGIGSTGQVLTVVSGSPTWTAPVSANAVSNFTTSNYSVTNANSSTPATVNLSVAGTYMLCTSNNANLSLTGTAAQGAAIYTWIQDTTNSLMIPGSQLPPLTVFLPTSVTALTYVSSCTLGPFIYTPATVPATLVLQTIWSNFATGITIVGALLQPGTGITAVRIA